MITCMGRPVMLVLCKRQRGLSMKHLALTAAALSLVACENLPTDIGGPLTSEASLADYYSTIPDSALPATSVGKPLPASDAVISRVLVGSCNDEELASPALAQIAREKADLFLMVGDNVYGDKDGPRYMNNDPDLTEVRESYSDLGKQADFLAARAAHPMICLLYTSPSPRDA